MAYSLTQHLQQPALNEAPSYQTFPQRRGRSEQLLTCELPPGRGADTLLTSSLRQSAAALGGPQGQGASGLFLACPRQSNQQLPAKPQPRLCRMVQPPAEPGTGGERGGLDREITSVRPPWAPCRFVQSQADLEVPDPMQVPRAALGDSSHPPAGSVPASWQCLRSPARAARHVGPTLPSPEGASSG